MRIWGRLVVAAAAALVATQAGLGSAWAEPSHPGGVPDTCPEVLAGQPTGGVEKVTQPPDGSDVHPGEVIEVSLRWEPGTFDRPVLHKALDCVTLDGRFVTDLSLQERDPANDGRFEHTYVVPDGLADGTRLCDRGFVSGSAREDEFDRLKSNDVCFTVRAATPAEAPALATAPAPAPAPAVSSPVAGSTPNLDTQLMALGGPDTVAGPVGETVAPLPDVSPGAPLPEVAQGVIQGPGTAPTTAPFAAESAPGEVSGSGGYLPRTGVDARTWTLIGLTLMLVGLTLRRRTMAPGPDQV